MKRALRSSWPAGLALALAATVAHADYVVLRADAGHFEVGQLLDNDAGLVLRDGERLILLSDNGEIIELSGPYDGLPRGAVADQVDVKDALAHLIDSTDSMYAILGSTRGGAADADPAAERDAWQLDPFTNGVQCVVQGEAASFWRASTKEPLSLVIQRPGFDGTGTLSWPAGTAMAPWPENMPLVDHELYVLRRSGWMENAMIRIVVLPPDIARRPETAIAWLAINGCKPQAEILLAGLP
jgi:hypothetical protein